MKQGFVEGSRKRRNEARICSEFIVADMEEIGNRYMSRNKPESSCRHWRFDTER